jgi:shikimate kinase
MKQTISSKRNKKFDNFSLKIGCRIYLIGFMAVGKTTYGKQIAAALQYKFVDLDAIIEKEENKTIVEIFETVGEPAFRIRIFT